MSPWEKLLEKPHSGGHFVQLYEADDVGLAKNVGRYLWEGLRRGQGVLLIATKEHQALFFRCLDFLGADLAHLLDSRQLVSWDAQQTLSRCVVDGQPDWRLFEKAICAAIRQLRPKEGVQALRAYGDMTALLWKNRQYAAAQRLEQLWNKLLEQSSISLYCAYSLDMFGSDCDVAHLENALCMHTHLIPADSHGLLEPALDRSMDEVLGAKAATLRAAIKTHHRPSWAVMPSAENIVLWLRKHVPQEAERIMALAREYYHRQIRTADAAD